MITKKIIFFFILNFVLIKIANASDSLIVFRNTSETRLLGKYIYILKDESSKLSFREIKNNAGFIRSSSEVPNLGVTPHTYWIKFSILNLSDEETLLLNFSQPFTNEAILYSLNDNKYSVQFAGDDFPFHYRKYKHPNIIFQLKIKNKEIKTFFIKIRSDEQILLPLKLGERTTILSELHNIDLIFGVYCGIILAMFFYNLFIYFSVKDKIYLRYVFYILFIGLTQASILGYPFEYLWPDSPYFANLSIDIFSCFVGITALEFLKPFLQTKRFAPKLHNFSYVITYLYVFTGILSIAGFMHAAYLLVLAMAGFIAVYMFIVAILITKKGYKPAQFFLLAWSVMLFGITIFVLKDFGFLPINAFTSYTMPIGSALETILLAIALADRINILKKEKEESQAEALIVSQQNQKLITEQNIVLEQKVHERTLELEETNEELNVTLSYLKDTQAQLVDAEKMASLGQLTAGIAHEINNPINFVSANLTPLKMDIKEILELVKKYEEIKSSEDLESKIKNIDAYKKEIDLDYLTKEIDTLLAGIEDGARRTAEIVLGLKIFSRLDESDIKKANINDGIESTLVILRSSVPDNVELKLSLGTIPLIDCFPGKLNQVFMNLFTNALYAMKQKSLTEKNTLIINSFEKNDKIYVTIEDTGIGMSKKIKEKIFEPFFTTKDVGEGTGLGMSIVFKIVESHQAKLEIESEEGKGSKVTLILNKTLN